MAEHAEAIRDRQGRVWVRCIDTRGRVMPYVDLVEAAPIWSERIRITGGPAYSAAWSADHDESLTYDFDVFNQ